MSNWSKEEMFYAFLAMVAIVVIIFLNADSIWRNVDETLSPLERYDGDDVFAVANSGSADAQTIRAIVISWEQGNVTVNYADQDRITFGEEFTEGIPMDDQVMAYWMKTTTLYVSYFSQEYSTLNKQTNRNVSKDLHMLIPQGIVMDEIIIHTANGHVACNVEAVKKDILCR